MIKEIALPFDVELAPVTLLKAGELQCVYELGKLRYICLGNTELLRMMYAPVRNHHWGTLPYTIEDEKIIVHADSFSIQYTAVYTQGHPVYKAVFNIEGNADSSITFSMKGTALATFQKNRIGICLHHPIKECSGREATITRPDNSVYKSVFPELVSPHQPFTEIQQMQWTTADNIQVQLFFEGDIFETEDQRNWSDSSYKTYSTPLHIPFPVQMNAGDRMEQKIKLSVQNNSGLIEPPAIVITEEKMAFPEIGFSQPADGYPITVAELLFLQDIPFHHYRVKIDMDNTNWKQALSTACADAIQLQTKLELVIFFSEQFPAELDALLPLLSAKPDLIYSMLVLQNKEAVSPAGLLMYVYPAVKKVLPAVLVGYGTDWNFVDVNRNRPVDTIFDFVGYSLHPQAHMTDNRSIVENLSNLPDMIATAKSFAPGRLVFISPVTITDRYDITLGKDERQYTAMVAWWMLMSLQQLAMAGSITFCELFGEAGLLRLSKNEKGQTISVQPSIFYEVLAVIHQFQPVWIIKRTVVSHTLINGLLLENAEGERLFFAAPEEIVKYKG